MKKVTKLPQPNDFWFCGKVIAEPVPSTQVVMLIA
jgi:hypothetical protein